MTNNPFLCEQALREADECGSIPGAWAKVFADTVGEQNRATARYKKFRGPTLGGKGSQGSKNSAEAPHEQLALVRIPAKLTDESDDVDRVVSCGAWRSDFSAVGHHRCQFSVLESRCTTAGQPESPASAWTEVADHWVVPV